MSNENDYIFKEFSVKVGKEEIISQIISPAKCRLSDDPALLLDFALGKELSLDEEPYNIMAKSFLKKGHRIFSFDILGHGKRIGKYGKGIDCWRNAFLDRYDYFSVFLEEASAGPYGSKYQAWIR